MIQIVCDNCEKTFEISDDLAGGKTKCPMCGDMNRIPEDPGLASAASPGDEPRPEKGVLPPDEGPEQHICDVRPAMFRAHPFRAILIFLLFVGGIVGAAYAWKGEVSPWITYVALLPTVFAVLWAVKWWIAAHMWVKLSISNKRTVRQEGIITRKTSEVLHDHVRNVEIRQSFLQRILRVGFIGISSAGQDDIEIRVRDMPNPYRVKELIDMYRDM